MLYPPMSDLLENVNSRYLLVNVIARRARQVSIEAEKMGEPLSEKPVSIAIGEIAEGKLTASVKADDDADDEIEIELYEYSEEEISEEVGQEIE